MFGWRATTEQPGDASALERAEQFLSEYADSDQNELYALSLWGISMVFKQIFGDIDKYQSAAEDKRKKYLVFLGRTAIENVEKGEVISAACHNFFMNYLVATNGLSRGEMRGSIELVSDVLDGIVRLGAKKNDEIAEIENASREIVFSEFRFKIGSGFVVGPVTERAVVELSQLIIADLRDVLSTGDDFYWFLIEQHDRLLSEPAYVRNMLDECPLFSIEYEGKRSSESYIGKPNPGVEYIEKIRPEIRSWCANTVPISDPDELSTRVIAAAYGHWCRNWRRTLDGFRLEMAKQYQQNCLTNGDSRSAAQWGEVIAKLS